ncbi:MAG: FAD:protein FMN transferase ApbE [Oceanospirillaceae bacterium]|nr:FAD:protein FMN transferase ApbE [Oceanospirillaceae bacterium]
MKWPAALLLAVFVLTGCQQAPEPKMLGFNGLTMGTSFSLQWIGTDAAQVEVLRPKVGALLSAINQQMSTYIEDSELSRFNQAAAGTQMEVSAGLAEVVREALRISEVSGGAFDVTVGPLVNLWGFGPNGRIMEAPPEAKIDELKGLTGFSNISVEGHRIAKKGDQYVDLSAIAKGYGVDRVAALLEAEGVKSYLVEIGGELRASGLKPNGDPWRIAIETPRAGERAVERVISVSGAGVATSGDYRNYFEENGRRFSHTIDPRTGYPINHRLASVTVLRDTCAEADALATAIMVMGDEAGYAFAVEQGIAAFFISKQGEGFVDRATPAFNKYLQGGN